jgi:hypothetical protein
MAKGKKKKKGAPGFKKAGEAAAAKRKSKGEGMSEYGRIGTAAELYKRCIMQGMSNEACHKKVTAELGAKAAGTAAYPGWYRCYLRSHGFKNVPDNK